jgi:hypothetical protein
MLKYCVVKLTDRHTRCSKLFCSELFLAGQPPAGHGLLILEVSLSHTRRTTVGRTSLDKWSAPHRDLYLTPHNTHNKHTFTLPAGFEPAIPAGERPQTHDFDCAATGIGTQNIRSSRTKKKSVLTLPEAVTLVHRFHVTYNRKVAHTWPKHAALSTVSSNTAVVFDWMLWGGTAGWRVRRSRTL